MTDESTQLAIQLEKFNARLELSDQLYEQLVKRMEKMDQTLHSTDPKDPGVAQRVDRIEQAMLTNQRILTWIFGGGVITAIGTLALLVKLSNLHS